MMKKLFIICYLLLGMNIDAQDDGRGIRVVEGAENFSGTKRALIVGISDYNEPKLKLNFAHNDAILFKNYLEKVEKISKDNIDFLIDKDADARSVMNALRKLSKNTASGDEVYIYFAGHGDVVDDFGKEEGFLLTADVNASREYYGTGGVLELRILDNVLTQLTDKGAHVNLILDACHSGFISKEGSQKNLQTINNNFQHSTKFLSCKPNQLSYESKELQQGYFTYYLVLAMMGAADQTVPDYKLQFFELALFLEENVKNESNQMQTPVIWNQSTTNVFKTVEPGDKNEAMASLKKTGVIKDLFASRGSEAALNTDETEHPLVKQFNAAIEKEELWGTDKSAYEILLLAKKDKNLSESLLERMQFSLVKSLSISAQMLINYYIEGNEILPPAKDFETKARGLEIGLSLLDKDDFMRIRLQVSKLFMEGYAIYRAKNYSNYRKAEEKLLEAMQIEPKAAYVHNALGILYNNKEQYAKAEEHYRKAMELIPTWSYPVNNLGSNYRDQDQNDKAMDYYRKALELHGGKSSPYNNMGAIYEERGMYKKAEEYYKKSLEYDPKDVITQKNLGNLLKTKGNIRESKIWLEKAIRTDSLNALREYGLSNYISDFAIDLNAAQKLYEDFLKAEPYYSEGYSNYADFIRFNFDTPEQIKKAEQLYNTAIENDPFNTWAYAGKGWLMQERLKKTEDALKSFKEGVEKNPHKESSYYYLANFYESILKNTEEAEKNYLKALEINPYYPYASSELIDLYKKSNRNEKVLALIEENTRKNPESPESWNLKGNYYFSLEDYSGAVEAYLKAIETDSDYAKGYANISYCYLMLDQPESAVQYYKKATESNPITNRPEIFSSQLISQFRKLNASGQYIQARKLIELANDYAPALETKFLLCEFYYLQDIQKDYTSILEEIINNTESSSWSVKASELALKTAIDKNDLKNTDICYSKLKEFNIKLYPVLELLYLYRTKGMTEAAVKKASMNALYFRDEMLQPKFSKKSIELINEIK